MADITMCKNDKCPNSSSCLRYNAVPSLMQAYFMGTDKSDGDCEYYIRTDKYIKLRGNQ